MSGRAAVSTVATHGPAQGFAQVCSHISWVSPGCGIARSRMGVCLTLKEGARQFCKVTTLFHALLCHSQKGIPVTQSCLAPQPYGLQHTRLPCPSPSPGVCPSLCPFHRWCHPTISSSVALFSFCLQFFPASGSFPMSQLFTSDG